MPRGTRTFAIVGSAVALLELIAALALDVRLRDAGHADLSGFDSSAGPFLIAMVATIGVGLVLSLRTDHPVGPLFVGLAIALCLSGLLDAYDRLSLLTDPPIYRGSRWLLSLDEASFGPWMVLISAVLLVTPSGRLPHRRWRTALAVAALCAVGLYVTRSLVPGTFAPPYQRYRHPVELNSHGVLEAVRLVAGMVVSVFPLAAAISLFRRWRRAEGETRQQLRWVAYGAAMTFLGLGLTVAAAYTGQPYLLTVLSGASLTFLPITTGIAVSRYRLYDLDRVISRTVTYAVVSAFLVALWTLGVIAVAAAISANVDSALPASIATLAAAAAGVPVLRGVRDVVDKRFRRRRYDALRTVRTWVGRPAGEAASEGVEQVLRAALRDDALQVAFWLEASSGTSTARVTWSSRSSRGRC